MLRIDRKAKEFTKLPTIPLTQVGIKERYDLQQMIRNCPKAFFEEIGEELLLVGEEVRPTSFVEDRIDLLALDPQGAVVVMELKRNSSKLQLLQALSYAGMVSKWKPEEVLALRQQLLNHSQNEVEDEIEQFLVEDAGNVNSSQRIILVAEDFGYEVLVTAEWLSEGYDVDIRCYRLLLSADGQSEFLTCTCIYPPSEITQHAIRTGRTPKALKWSDWESAFKSIENQDIVAFFQKELDAGRESYLRKRVLRYRLDGTRRFHVAAHNKVAYVWQSGRFSGDEAYWKNKLGDHIDVKPVKEGQSLRFFLSRASDFERFLEAFNGDIGKVEFFDNGSELE